MYSQVSLAKREPKAGPRESNSNNNNNDGNSNSNSNSNDIYRRVFQTGGPRRIKTYTDTRRVKKKRSGCKEEETRQINQSIDIDGHNQISTMYEVSKIDEDVRFYIQAVGRRGEHGIWIDVVDVS